MNFDIPERVEKILGEIDAFVADHVEPLKARYPNFFGEDADRLSVMPDGSLDPEIPRIRKDLRKRAVEAGLYGLHMPESVGGRGLSRLDRVLVAEHITNAPPMSSILWPNLQAYVTGEIWGPTPVLLYANKEVQGRMLRGFMQADLTQAIALTDPSAGSDPQNMDMTAEQRGDRYVLNGEKVFIGNGALADVLMVYARTSGEKGQHKGLSMFLVEQGTPGCSVKRMFRPLEGIGNHAHLQFEDCEIPVENLVGDEGRGLYVGLEFLSEGRLRHAATGVGASKWLLDRTIDYVKTRHTFGEPLSSRQGVQWQLAEAATMIEQLQWLTRYAAWKVDQGGRVIKEVAMAKAQGAIVQTHVASLALQLHGGAGFMSDLPIERAFRHARMYTLTEGGVEIQRQNIAKQILSRSD